MQINDEVIFKGQKAKILGKCYGRLSFDVLTEDGFVHWYVQPDQLSYPVESVAVSCGGAVQIIEFKR